MKIHELESIIFTSSSDADIIGKIHDYMQNLSRPASPSSNLHRDTCCLRVSNYITIKLPTLLLR